VVVVVVVVMVSFIMPDPESVNTWRVIGRGLRFRPPTIEDLVALGLKLHAQT